MDRETLINELRNTIRDFLRTKDIELFDLIYRYEGKDLVLRILADRPCGGISLDECASLNKDIGMFLDEKDIIQGHYILEVSSPGLDRTLRNKNDFLRCLNKPVKFFLKIPVEGKIELDGRINRVEDDAVYIEKEGKIMQITLSGINKAKQIV